MARAAGVYQSPFTELIHRFKYQGKIQLVPPLARLLYCVFEMFWQPDDIDLVVPVPLHMRRFRARGFNQAYLLIRGWKQMVPKCPDVQFQVGREVLIRKRWTAPQVGLDRSERITNIKGAFELNSAATIQGKRILLIDDVLTTGTTVNECAGVLLRSGARHVDVLTLARAM
jgi:ComF family protein